MSWSVSRFHGLHLERRSLSSTLNAVWWRWKKDDVGKEEKKKKDEKSRIVENAKNNDTFYVYENSSLLLIALRRTRNKETERRKKRSKTNYYSTFSLSEKATERKKNNEILLATGTFPRRNNNIVCWLVHSNNEHQPNRLALMDNEIDQKQCWKNFHDSHISIHSRLMSKKYAALDLWFFFFYWKTLKQTHLLNHDRLKYLMVGCVLQHTNAMADNPRKPTLLNLQSQQDTD